MWIEEEGVYEYNFDMVFKGEEDQLDAIYEALDVDPLIGMGVPGHLAVAITVRDVDPNKWLKYVDKYGKILAEVLGQDNFVKIAVPDPEDYKDYLLCIQIGHPSAKERRSAKHLLRKIEGKTLGSLKKR